MESTKNPTTFRITKLYADKVHELKTHLETSTGMNISHTQAIYYAVETSLNNLKSEVKV